MPSDPLDMSSLWPHFTWPSRRGMLAHLWGKTWSHHWREVASVVVLMVENVSVVKRGPRFYRCLENGKTDSLKLASGNLDSRMPLSEIAIKIP